MKLENKNIKGIPFCFLFSLHWSFYLVDTDTTIIVVTGKESELNYYISPVFETNKFVDIKHVTF